MLRRSTAPTESPSLRHGVVFDEGANFSLEPVREPDTPSLDGPTSSREAPSPSLTTDLKERDESVQHERSRKRQTKQSVAMTKASFPRASRAARASDPGESAKKEAYDIVIKRLKEIHAMQLEKAPKDTQAFKSHKVNLGTGGKGPGVHTSSRDQNRMNHITSIKAKDIDTNNTEPAFLLGGFTAPMMWDRLAESSLKSNAVNSSVMGRKKTQGIPPTATMHERHASNFSTCVCHRSGKPNNVRSTSNPKVPLPTTVALCAQAHQLQVDRPGGRCSGRVRGVGNGGG